MNNILIVEGPDNIGKDTFIKNFISSNLHKIWQVLHYSNLKISNERSISYSTSLYSDAFDLMLDNQDNLKRGLIFNRCHLGESVYSPLYRKYNGDYIFDIERRYTDKLNKVVLLLLYTSDPESIFKRDDGKSFYTDAESLKWENDEFRNAYSKSSIKNKMQLDVANKTPEQILEDFNEIYKF